MAKGDDGEIVAWNESEANVREEVNRRTCKAGYTTKYGEPNVRTKIMSLVGFGESKLSVWPRDSEGNLIDD